MRNQSGRSMLEILGVLAIIGVLSVGGLTAYNYAMDKKVVNDLMYDMELATTEIWTSGTTGPGDLGKEMDVSVLGENHPNITVRKLQHVENGEIVLDEADGEITEEDVAAVENGEEPAFSIEIHDITVAQCVQLLRNQDKLNTPFLLEDSDGNVFDPENGDDPQDFCERIFGGDDPVAFGLISNAYAKKGGFLSIFHRETPGEKFQRELEDCAKQPKNTSPYIIKGGKLCGSSGDCDCYNPVEKVYFMTFGKECIEMGTSYHDTFIFDPCAGTEEHRKKAIAHIETTEVTDLMGGELVFKGVWFGRQVHDNPKSVRGFHAEHAHAHVPCPDGTKWMTDKEGRERGRGYDEDTRSNGYACYCSDPKNPVWDRANKQCTVCPDGTEWMLDTEGGEGRGRVDATYSPYSPSYACYCPDTNNPVWHKGEKRCTVCPDGAEWIPFLEGKKEKLQDVPDTYSNYYACYCPKGKPFWNETTRQCVECEEEGQISDGKGHCCNPQTGEGCECTKAYLKNKYEKCGDDCKGEKETLEKYLTDGVLVDDGGIVRFSGTYRKGTCATCVGDDTWCSGPAACCPCSRLTNEEGLDVNNGECNYCLKEFISGYTSEGLKAEQLKAAVGEEEVKVKSVPPNFTGGTCLKCAKYGGVWVPGSEDESSVEYTRDSSCVFCPKNRPKWNGDSCESCPDGSPYWNGKECVPCPSDEPKWNGKECESCPDQTYWDGYDCVTCHQYGGETPYWNDDKKQCEKCPDQTPKWNDASKQCEKCPEGLVYNSGSCIGDPSAFCPEEAGYYWNPGLACCFNPFEGECVN